jgi:hypothetical protein
MSEATSIRNHEPYFKPEVLSGVLSRLRAGLDPERAADERVLHNLLYFVDFNCYEKYEVQMTGSTYRKDAAGPTNVQLLKSSTAEAPDPATLDDNALAVVDEVLAKYATMPPSKLAEQARRDVPWVTARACQTIDYESVFYRRPEFSVRIYPEFATVVDQLPAVASVDGWEVFYDPQVDSLYWKSPELSRGARILKASRDAQLYLSGTGRIEGVLIENLQSSFMERHAEFRNLMDAFEKGPCCGYYVLRSRDQIILELFSRLAEALKDGIYRDAADDHLTTDDLNFMMSETLSGWRVRLTVPSLSTSHA